MGKQHFAGSITIGCLTSVGLLVMGLSSCSVDKSPQSAVDGAKAMSPKENENASKLAESVTDTSPDRSDDGSVAEVVGIPVVSVEDELKKQEAASSDDPTDLATDSETTQRPRAEVTVSSDRSAGPAVRIESLDQAIRLLSSEDRQDLETASEWLAENQSDQLIEFLLGNCLRRYPTKKAYYSWITLVKIGTPVLKHARKKLKLYPSVPRTGGFGWGGAAVLNDGRRLLISLIQEIQAQNPESPNSEAERKR